MPELVIRGNSGILSSSGNQGTYRNKKIRGMIRPVNNGTSEAATLTYQQAESMDIQATICGDGRLKILSQVDSPAVPARISGDNSGFTGRLVLGLSEANHAMNLVVTNASALGGAMAAATEDGVTFAATGVTDCSRVSLTAADEWEFEALRWGNSGSSAWNGTESIHGRSTWGRLRFRIPEEARARIARRLLAKAVSAYRREKTSEKNFEGVLAHWQDADNGDPKFYREEVAPIVERLDAIVTRVEAGLSDGQTIRMSGRELEELRDMRKTVARRREIWLSKRRIGE